LQETGSDPSDVFFIIGTIDSRTGMTAVLDQPHDEASVEVGPPREHDFLDVHAKDFADFFFACFVYDDAGHRSGPPEFYAQQPPRPPRSGLRSANSKEEQALLASGFSCAKAEK
jgi:hypothetical protein